MARLSKRAHRAHSKSQRAPAPPDARRRLPVVSGVETAAGGGRVNGNGHGDGNGHANGHGNGNGNGNRRALVPCTSCGLCCTYVSIGIEGPRTVDDAATMLWYLYHPGLSIYTCDGDWVLQLDSRCKFLQPDNRCAIYEHRPPICRSFDETDCEVNARDVGISFYEPQSFLDYLQREHPRIHARVSKSFVPPHGMLGAKPADARKLPPFEPRVRALRVLAHG